jgi:hypothetical protein
VSLGRGGRRTAPERGISLATLRTGRRRPRVSGRSVKTGPITEQGSRVEMALEQACPPEYQGAQCAFKDSMIH